MNQYLWTQQGTLSLPRGYCHLNAHLPWVWIGHAGVIDIVGMCLSCLYPDLSNCGGSELHLLQYGMCQIIVSASAIW